MNSTEILETFREEMNDEAEPFLWSDLLMFRAMNDAQSMFCRLTQGIEDSSTAEITQLTIDADEDWVTLDRRILKVREVVNRATGRPYKIHNMEDAASRGILFDGRTGAISDFVTGLEKYKLRAWPKPVEDTNIELRVFRLPLVSITDEGDEELEVDEQHHLGLILWMKHKAYGKEDAETFDRSKRDDYEQRFYVYCAKALQEQTRMRRETGAVAYGGI